MPFSFTNRLEVYVLILEFDLLLKLQARTLILKLTEEKNSTLQLTNKLRQELVSDFVLHLHISFYFLIASVLLLVNAI